ncbi:MAG: ABC transporter ATP-binding protein [Beutenbergiaceae bacterium]
MTGAPALQVRDLTFAYGSNPATLTGVNLTLQPGEILVILGANGSGKSTLLNCLGRILRPDSGEIQLHRKTIESYEIGQLARELGYVPQVSELTISSTVRDYVVMGRAPYLGMLSVPGPAEYDIADQMLELLGIEHLADHPCHQISGGERQQVHIARVLAQQTPVVLLDEPTNHLDFGNQLKILNLIAQLSARGLTIILTTHVPDHAILLDGTVGMLGSDGRLAVGSASEVITQQALRDLYDTELHLVHIDALDRLACIPGRLSGGSAHRPDLQDDKERIG